MEILLSICSKTDGSVREAKCELVDRVVVGRGAEDGVLLDGPDLSREHLMLSADGTTVYVTDLSVNGTWLNGTRLRKSVRNRVQPEDSIEVPGYVLTVRPTEQVEEVRPMAAVPRSLQSPAENQLTTPPAPARPSGMLAPVFRVIGSFTFAEKFLFVVGVSGLLLVYIYAAT